MIKTNLQQDFDMCMFTLEKESDKVKEKDLEIKKMIVVIDKLERAIIKLINENN